MKKLFLLIILFVPLQLFAAEDIYRFTSVNDQQRFATLTTQLRCLVCQNQTLAESNAPLAADLRQQIYRHLQQGQSDKEIADYLVARYGNFILYRPLFNATTWALWLGPLLFLLTGVLYLLYYIRQKRRD